MIEQILAQKGPAPQLYNMNIPTAALNAPSAGCAWCRWASSEAASSTKSGSTRAGGVIFGPLSDPVAGTAGHETDVSALAGGAITLTPLDFDLTKRANWPKWNAGNSSCRPTSNLAE